MLSRLPAVTRALLIANIAIALIDLMLTASGHIGLILPLRLWPLLPAEMSLPGAYGFMPWQLVTHGFLHADPVHLVLNMIGLVMFGAPLEHLWRSRRFAVFYAVSMLGGGLCQLALTSWLVREGYPPMSTVGASGAIFGLMLAFALNHPNHRIGLLFLPIMLKARTFILILIALQLVLAVLPGSGNVAYLAHLGGALAGWLLLRWWQRPRSRPPSPPSGGRRDRANPLRLVR